MLLFVQLTLSKEKQESVEASVATKLRADYRPDEWVEMRRFVPSGRRSLTKLPDSIERLPSTTTVVCKTSTLSLSKSAVSKRTSSFDRLRMTVSRWKRACKPSHFSK